MASILLNVTQFDPANQQALRKLNDALPVGYTVRSEGPRIAVVYPDGQSPEEARAVVAAALDQIGVQGGVSIA